MPVTTNGPATVTIGTLPGPGDLAAPADGLGTITKLQYRVNGGPVYDLPSVSTTAFSVDLAIWAGATVPIDVRAVSAAGNSPWSIADTATVTGAALAAPTGSGSIADVLLQEDTGVLTVATAAAFSGGSRAYSLDTSLAGLSINAATGVVSIDSAKIGRRLDTTITVRAHNGAGTATRSFLLSVGPQFGFSVPTGDMSAWSTTQRSTEMGRMATAQGGYVRFDFDWNNIETAAGVFSWTLADDLVSRATTAGLQVLGIIKNSKTYGGAAFNDLPATPSEFKTFCQTVAARYPEIELWQIWNEPNGAGFSTTPDNGSAYCARALAPGYEGVKAGNASASVIYGGISNKDTADGTDARDFLMASMGVGEKLPATDNPGFAVSFGVATLTTPGGRLRITNGAADFSGAQLLFTTVIGKAYRLRVTIHGGTAGGTLVIANADPGGDMQQYYGAGTYEFHWTATTTVGRIFIATNTNVNGNYTEFSGFSVWEANAAEVCDFYADHPYIDTVWPGTRTWTATDSWMGTQISRLMRADLVAIGKAKPFITTEFGGATFGTNSGARSPMTQSNQAAMLLECWRQSCVNEPWRKAFMVYTWANRQPEGTTDATEDAFGVVDARTAGTPFAAKPAVATLTTIKRGS